MLVSRGEFELILASLAVAAGLDSRVAPFAALYVLVLSILSPLFSARSSVLAGWLPRRLFAPQPAVEPADEQEDSEPIIEVGVIRRLGAETVEYPVRPDYAIVGAHVRDLDLPRDALVSVIVRGTEAIAPRGSTRIRAGDRLHILVRREVAREVEALQERWRRGPMGTPPRPRRRLRGSSPIFTVRPSDERVVIGDIDDPRRVLNQAVVARLRVRRDRPGALVALEDGRYAVTGPLLIAGSREDVTGYARRRVTLDDPDERAWLQTIVGALAIDIFDSVSANHRPPAEVPLAGSVER
jgi:cell volume regulation protein A